MTCPDDYNIVLVRLPGDIYGAMRVDPDGYPTVYLNEALAPDAKRRALDHELEHIRAGHLWDHISIYDAEADAIRAEAVTVKFCNRSGAPAELPVTEVLQRLSELASAAAEPLPDALYTLRHLRVMTPSNVAARLNTTPEAVRSWETGEAVPDAATLAQLSALYGIDLQRR